MSKLDVKLKHAGKVYDATVELDAPGLAFKEQIHQLTGVEPAKVKVVVKGGMLKVSSGRCTGCTEADPCRPAG